MTWRLDEIQAGWCVRFLVDSADVADYLPKGYRALRADEAEELHPAVRRTIAEQEEFGAWTPSDLCFYFADRITIGERTVTDRKDTPMVAIWTVPVADPESPTEGSEVAVRLLSNNSKVIRPAEVALLDVREVDTQIGKVPDSSDDRYVIRIGKTRLVWDGRLARDSIVVEAPQERVASAVGRRGSNWEITTTFSPAAERLLVGSLRVEGKDDFAKLLKASPIRYVGPFYRGGTATVAFAR